MGDEHLGHLTYSLSATRIQCLTPGAHYKWIIDADDEDLAGILEIWMSEVARNVLLRAPRACAVPSV